MINDVTGAKHTQRAHIPAEDETETVVPAKVQLRIMDFQEMARSAQRHSGG